jgi:PP-loop superfamily ATP-utilizing enzyme
LILESRKQGSALIGDARVDPLQQPCFRRATLGAIGVCLGLKSWKQAACQPKRFKVSKEIQPSRPKMNAEAAFWRDQILVRHTRIA